MRGSSDENWSFRTRIPQRRAKVHAVSSFQTIEVCTRTLWNLVGTLINASFPSPIAADWAPKESNSTQKV